MKVTKAVLTVAGLGTRLMPLTINQPKAMIFIADRPMIHYVIDDLIASGIREIVIVFSHQAEIFKKYLAYIKKDDAWKQVQFHFIKQDAQHGIADAIYTAKPFVGDDPFVVAYCDDLFGEQEPPLKTMIRFFEKQKEPTLLLEKIPKKLVNMYGVAELGKEQKDGFYAIADVIEKPDVNKAPSNLTILGRYVLPPDIFIYIEELYPYRGKELYLTDAIRLYLQDRGKSWGLHFKGTHFDCGSMKGLLKAQAYFALRHPLAKRK